MLEDCHLDWETRSACDLRKAGAHRYAEHPTTQIMCATYRFGHGNPRRWKAGDPAPHDLIEHVRNGGMIKCHNAQFERWIWNLKFRALFPHAPELVAAQQDCTMSRAAATGFPQELGKLCKALKTTHVKNESGYAIMMKYCKPRSYRADGSIVWWDNPYELEQLYAYCDDDVLTETDIDDMLPPLTDYERKVWELDQRINDRGIFIDVTAVQKCVTIVELSKKSADKEMRRLTDRHVPKCSNDNKIIEWLNARGVECTTVKKGVQEELMFAGDCMDDPLVRQVIELRKDAKKTSTAKYNAMMQCVMDDGRIRGTLNYHGAGPGRWAGRLIQPQNLTRFDYKKEGWKFDWLVDMLNSDLTAPEVFEAMCVVHGESGKDAPLRLMSRALRSMIKAQPGNKLVGGDFSNIEGRINAWYGNEHWKLEAFSLYDAGLGPDLYKVTASDQTGKPIEEITDDERQAQGKVPELALGFQGGIGAYMDMGDTYEVNPYDLPKLVMATTTSMQWDEVACTYAKASDKKGLQEREWTAIKIIVNRWRAKHPGIVQSWWDLQDAAIAAVAAPGVLVPVLNGRCSYYSDGRCLWCILPSGRMICYAYPQLEQEEQTYYDKKTGEMRTRMRTKVSFWGYKEGRWQRLSLYGGLQCENIVQGTARCIMVDRMFAAEEAGYPLILTVHDELLAELSKLRTDLDDKRLEEIMSVVPAFAQGLPMAAKAWTDERYVK